MVWSTYDLGTLFLPTAVIFVVTAAVCLRVTGSVAGALAASLIKAGLFLFYFSTWFDGTYGLIDDQTYIRESEKLFSKGVGVFTLQDDWPLLVGTANGLHFGYYLFNVYAIHLFGHGYFAPAALNVLLTVLIAHLGTVVAEREFGFSGTVRMAFFYCLLLFPDILAWSTFINGKDVAVLYLHVMLLYGFSLWLQRRSLLALSLLIAASLLLLFFRFYVPLFFSVAFAISVLTVARIRHRLYWVVAGLFLVGAAVMTIGPDGIEQAVALLRRDFVNPIFGVPRFVLTPIPLNTETAYAFLDIVAAIHWLLIPFAVFGAYKIHQLGTPFSRFFLIYFVTFTALYSMFGELQGPRQRLQLDFAWAVFQFVGLLALAKDADRSRLAAKVGTT